MLNPKVKNKSWLSLGEDNKTQNIVAGSEVFSQNENFTVSLWMRAEIPNKEARIINFNYEGSKSSLIVGLEKGKYFYGFRDKDLKYVKTFVEFKTQPDEWTHIALSYDSESFKFFINGEKASEVANSFSGFGAGHTNLGSYQGKSHFFQGDLDEISLWEVSLNSEEITQLYNDGNPTQLGLHPQIDNVAKWWRMGDKVNRSIAGGLIIE